ncbi:unnamed protein product [Rhizophagus irregularis]|nr:unnamed protein product [Rhizophagus irregularis]
MTTSSPATVLNMATSSPFVVTSSENLTPDEIRNLLFNVDCSLEIPIDDFNENWWSLVTNIWTKWTSYKYIKRPQVIQTLVEKKAIKNYIPPAITSAVREYATKELDLEKTLIGDSNLTSDISQCISYLIEKGYKVKRYSIHQSSKGIVFAYPEQLKKLECYRWLTLIDSTHKTNRYDWCLFTLYIHDTYGCWDVGAYFFVSSESCKTVSQVLKIIRDSYCHWSPQYILSDQSSIEAKSKALHEPAREPKVL